MRGTFASPALRQYALTIVAFLPPAVLAVLIVQHWVNVPLLDEWDVPGQLLKEYFGDGHLRWTTLFAQHNESRMLFPQLAFLSAAILFGWDTRVPQTLVWLCALTMFLQWVWLARQTFSRSQTFRWTVLAVMSAVFFSTNQWESWLWGIQLQVFLPPLCLVTCLVLQQSRFRYGLQILLCALLAFVSTYSNANGMLCWILGFPLLDARPIGGVTPGVRRLRGGDVWCAAAYGAAMVFSIALYFRGYARPGQHPPLTEALQRPLAFAEYFISWVGNPLCRGVGGDPLHSAFALGLVTLAALFVAAIAVVRDWRHMLTAGLIGRLHPWTMIVLYGLLSGLITTAGRLSFGLEQAISTRYISFACYVIIGLIGVLAALPSSSFPAFCQRNSAWYLGAPAVAFLVSCFALNWRDGLRAFEGHRIEEEKMKLTLRLLLLMPDNPALTALYPSASRIKEIAVPLLAKRVLRHDIVGSWALDKLQQPDGTDDGWFAVQRAPTGESVSGWSILSDRKIRTQCIFVARSYAGAPTQLVAAAPVPRSQVVDGPTRLLITSFSVHVPMDAAAPEGSLRVFSVDLNRQKAFQLRARPASL